MSYRNVLTVTNIVFLIGGVYFAIVAGLGEATIYSLFLSVLCFLSVVFAVRQGFYLTGPWRVASAVAVVALLAGQEVAIFESSFLTDAFAAGTIVLNGALLFLFIGVLLSSAREVTRQKPSEEEEEEAEENEREEKTVRVSR